MFAIRSSFQQVKSGNSTEKYSPSLTTPNKQTPLSPSTSLHYLTSKRTKTIGGFLYPTTKEPKDIRVRPTLNLSKNPYGYRLEGKRQRNKGIYYAPSLYSPIWKKVQEKLVELEEPNFLDLRIPLAPPKFPESVHDANPDYLPRKKKELEVVKENYFNERRQLEIKLKKKREENANKN